MSEFLLQRAHLVISTKLGQRRLVEFAKNVAEFVGIFKSRSEARSIHFPQGADERVAVLAANLAVIHQPAPQATFKVKITKVHPDWILIRVGLLSKQAYVLELRSKLEFDFSQALTTIDVVCDGPQTSCTAFEKHVEWCVDYINQQLKNPAR